ncbi:unnamed protein product [Triticum turgidum subsp. durum]|uniref:Glycosyltransferase n=1 Tax=Triticum turgidum subsp. durum TaxID=4567 RepID=A0A9R0ZVP4_TRITD|nr:unnamed protein product [Triticum turgidum subsp. durum]
MIYMTIQVQSISMLLAKKASRGHRHEGPSFVLVALRDYQFTIDIAEELGIPALAFAMHGACSYLALLYMPKLGESPFPADDPVCGVPGMEGFLRRRDLPRGLYYAEQGHKTPGCSSSPRSPLVPARHVHSYSTPPRPWSNQRSLTLRRAQAIAIGPLHARSRFAASASLWQEDDGCMAWLDGHEDRSVVYVSLGSRAVITHEQFTEFLSGLVATGYAFLWALRPDMVQMTSSTLLREAIGAVEGGKARVVEWAPQRDVLQHQAVGCFLTHAGWNSNLECAMEGVPMVCWPFFSEQQINSRFVGAVWRTGLDMKDVCDRGVVERTVREAMDHGVRRDQRGGPSYGAAVEAECRGAGVVVVVRVGAARPLHQGAQHQVLLKPRTNED